MNSPIIPRDEVARRLQITTRVLVRYEERGLVRTIRSSGVEGYDPDQLGRLTTIVSLQRDLGVNLAGVEAILRLRSQMNESVARLREVAAEMLRELERADEGPARHA
jgi:MerR family transcriptional regulator/heat shock protein HspR